MISLETQSAQNSYYETTFVSPSNEIEVEHLIEEIQKGNHQAVIAYLHEGGSVNDRRPYALSVAYHCFQYLEPSQFREILSILPEDTELPWDTVIESEKGELIGRVEELLPDLEKFHYPFEVIYERVLREGYFNWIEFFLDKEIPSLELNHPVTNQEHMTVHPYTHMKIIAGRMFVFRLMMDYLNETDFASKDIEKEKDEFIRLTDQIDLILNKMENHPKIDFNRVHDEMGQLRAKGFYFIGDPELERGCHLVADAATFEGLERQVAQGFNLYEAIGPFFAAALWHDNDSTWIEVFSSMYGEYELVELMEKYTAPT